MVLNTASELYNNLLEIYFDEYYELSDAKRNKMKNNVILKSHFLKHIIMMTGLKMKNQLIQQGKIIKKNLTSHH